MGPIDTVCPVCKRFDEDGEHCFLKCKFLCVNVTPSKQRWSPPTRDIMKINVDGAFIQATKLGGWGFVVRDSAGEAVLAGAGGAADLHDALMAETVVCWKAVDAAVSHGMSRVQLETDSLMLQKGVLSVEMDQAPPGVIFQEIRTLIEEHFVHFECLHVPTICNSSAHEIATLGMSRGVNSWVIWEYLVPIFVQDIVARS